MDKLFRNWIVALSIGSVMGATLLVAGLVPVFKGSRSPALLDILICLAAAWTLAVCGQHWIKILKGKVVFKKNQTVALNRGEIRIPIPAGPFELWIFCRVPFAQYNGQVSIVRNGIEHIIKMPRRNPFLYPIRSNLVPIIWCLPHGEPNSQGQCCVIFYLLPSFDDTAYDRRVHKNNEELVSVLIKVPR